MPFHGFRGRYIPCLTFPSIGEDFEAGLQTVFRFPSARSSKPVDSILYGNQLPLGFCRAVRSKRDLPLQNCRSATGALFRRVFYFPFRHSVTVRPITASPAS